MFRRQKFDHRGGPTIDLRSSIYSFESRSFKNRPVIRLKWTGPPSCTDHLQLMISRREPFAKTLFDLRLKKMIQDARINSPCRKTGSIKRPSNIPAR